MSKAHLAKKNTYAKCHFLCEGKYSELVRDSIALFLWCRWLPNVALVEGARRVTVNRIYGLRLAPKN